MHNGRHETPAAAQSNVNEQSYSSRAFGNPPGGEFHAFQEEDPHAFPDEPQPGAPHAAILQQGDTHAKLGGGKAVEGEVIGMAVPGGGDAIMHHTHTAVPMGDLDRHHFENSQHLHNRPTPLRSLRDGNGGGERGRGRRHSDLSAGVTSSLTTYSNGSPITEGADQLDKDKNVVFRLVNKPTDGRKCQASYTTMDPLKPDADTLLRTTVFSQFISITDFNVLIEYANALMDGWRSRSLGLVFGFILLSFVCLILAIFVHPALGITVQLLGFVIHSALQKMIKERCVRDVNEALAEDINEPLIITRGVYFKFQVEGDGCFAAWMELDLCQLPGALEILRQHQAAAEAAQEEFKPDLSVRRSSSAGAFGFGGPQCEDPHKALDELRKTTPALRLPHGNPLVRSTPNIKSVESPVRKVRNPRRAADGVPPLPAAPSSPSFTHAPSESFTSFGESSHNKAQQPQPPAYSSQAVDGRPTYRPEKKSAPPVPNPGRQYHGGGDAHKDFTAI